MPSPLLPSLCIGPLYTGSERGLATDILAGRPNGFAPLTVCTAIVVASDDQVTDLTEVPVDTVESQLEHIASVARPVAIRIGALGSERNAIAVLDWVAEQDVPTVLEFVASGPSGETVLPARGLDRVAERLHVADLVILSRADAELVTGGEIASLDDAQVAAQRVGHRGAKAVLIDCGSLPARFYDAASDPGEAGGALAHAFLLGYDGEDFYLFEVPRLESKGDRIGVLSAAVLQAMVQGRSLEESLQAGTAAYVECVRWQREVENRQSLLSPDWKSEERSQQE